MKFTPKEHEKMISMQNAKRAHAKTWGRFKFIHAKYIPKRFINFKGFK